MRPTRRLGASFALSAAIHAALLLGLPAIAWWSSGRAKAAPKTAEVSGKHLAAPATHLGLGEGEQARLLADGLPGVPRPKPTARSEARTFRVWLLPTAAARPAREASSEPTAAAQALAQPPRPNLVPRPPDALRRTGSGRESALRTARSALASALRRMDRAAPSPDMRVALAQPARLPEARAVQPAARESLASPAEHSALAVLASAARAASAAVAPPLPEFPSLASAAKAALEAEKRKVEASPLPEGDGLGARGGGRESGGGYDPARLVQERIAWVARLLSPSVVRRAHSAGAARVAVAVNGLGYVRGMRVLQSTGSQVLDAELESTVHFAEPFPLWDGWLTFTVDYQRRD